MTRIGILGGGTVGTALVRLIQDNLYDRFRVVQVGVRDIAKPRDIHESLLTTDLAGIVDNPGVDAIIEVMGGMDPAWPLIQRAAELGKPVVTANKELVARKFDEVFELDTQVLFEAAVCAGVPVIQVIETLAQTNEITRIRGVLNGTTNYMLSRMQQEGIGFNECLADAQRLGYAEADPSSDVDGWDSAYKLAILVGLATEEAPDVNKMDRIGIRDLPDSKPGEVVRLVAEWTFHDGARVSPQILSGDDPLASLEGTRNGVVIEGDYCGSLMLSGPGAGGKETASAIVGDLVQLFPA